MSNNSDLQSPSLENDNITIRRKQQSNITISTENSFASLSVDDDNACSSITSYDNHNISCPQLQETKNETIIELETLVNTLREKLASADCEIENLLTENISLKNIITNNEKVINNLKRICISTPERVSSATKRKSINKDKPKLSHDHLIQKRNKPEKQSKITSPKSLIKTQKLSNKRATTEKQRTNSLCSTNSKQNITTQRSEIEDNCMKSSRNKLCIVSANKTNSILSIAEQTFQNLQICHYLSPKCGLLQLISNLHEKLEDYSFNDYCVILIGEEDFQITKNYVEIVIELRKTLENIQHTNIILCLPTFKLSDYSMMFNWRIETFNNLLYLDLLTHNYVTVLDSNFDLSYDFTMFSKYNRKLNNQGMRNIFQNLLLLINDYQMSSSELEPDLENNVNTNAHTEFFL